MEISDKIKLAYFGGESNIAKKRINDILFCKAKARIDSGNFVSGQEYEDTINYYLSNIDFPEQEEEQIQYYLLKTLHNIRKKYTPIKYKESSFNLQGFCYLYKCKRDLLLYIIPILKERDFIGYSSGTSIYEGGLHITDSGIKTLLQVEKRTILLEGLGEEGSSLIPYINMVNDEFNMVRLVVDKFILTKCRKAAPQLIAIFERFREKQEESYAQALLSCRRVLMTVADSVYAPQKENYIDSKNRQRKVGIEEYKNRLLAFLDLKISSGSTIELLESQMEHLVARLDVVYEKSCKGVHADVSATEARLTILHTYLFIAEIARFE